MKTEGRVSCDINKHDQENLKHGTRRVWSFYMFWLLDGATLLLAFSHDFFLLLIYVGFSEDYALKVGYARLSASRITGL